MSWIQLEVTPVDSTVTIDGLGRVAGARDRRDAAEEPRSMARAWTLDDPDLQRVLKGMIGKLCYPAFTCEDREEVFQETLRRLVEKGESAGGMPREFCSGFLYTTALNVVREQWRKVVGPRQNTLPLSDDVDCPKPRGQQPKVPERSNPWRVPPSIVADPFQAMMREEIRKSVRGCLKWLHRTRRRPVFLKMLGFKTSEIAQRLGGTPKSVENRVLRGMQQLRQCLEGQGVTP